MYLSDLTSCRSIHFKFIGPHDNRLTISCMYVTVVQMWNLLASLYKTRFHCMQNIYHQQIVHRWPTYLAAFNRLFETLLVHPFNFTKISSGISAYVFAHTLVAFMGRTIKTIQFHAFFPKKVYFSMLQTICHVCQEFICQQDCDI